MCISIGRTATRFGPLLVVLAVTAFTSQALGQGSLEDRVRALEKQSRDQDRVIENLRQGDGSSGSTAGPNDLRVFWKNGVKLETADKRFKLAIFGRAQVDIGFVSENSNYEQIIGKQEDAIGLRRGRIGIGGTIYERIVFKAEYDFAGGDADFTDVFVGINKLPIVGTVTVGHQHEPFGLETLTSNKYITFAERSVIQTFSPERNTGIRLWNSFENRYTVAAGIFKQANSYGNGSGDGDFNITGRVTALVVDQEDGRRIVHVGLGYQYRNANGDGVQYRSRPEINLADRFVDTGVFAADEVHSFGFEGAAVFDAFSVQAEYVLVDASEVPGSSGQFRGGYVLASYFLTGESRNYNRKRGSFKRVSPNKNAFEGDGLGAWEVAGRVSMIDLNDGALRGGEACTITAGVNCYLNPNTKVMVNVGHTDRDQGAEAKFVVFRFQVDF